MKNFLIGRWLLIKDCAFDFIQVTKHMIEYVEEGDLNKFGIVISKILILILFSCIFSVLFLVGMPIVLLFVKTPHKI